MLTKRHLKKILEAFVKCIRSPEWENTLFVYRHIIKRACKIFFPWQICDLKNGWGSAKPILSYVKATATATATSGYTECMNKKYYKPLAIL